MTDTRLPGIKQFDMNGRTAMITGGSKGLGLAMAAGLASAGCSTALVNRNLEEGISAAEELNKDFGVKAKAYSADVTNLKQVYKISNAVNTTKDLNELLTVIRLELSNVIDTSNLFIALYDKEK